MEVVGLPDGAALVVEGMEAPEIAPERPAEGTLGGPIEIAGWVGDAVAAGVTFDVLKEVAVSLLKRGWRRRSTPATAESITRAVESYLRSCGYVDIRVTEIRLIARQGWILNGVANGAPFSGLTDESGNVIHVNVR